MPRRLYRPALRAVETIVVPDPEHGRVLVLRDTQGVSSAHAYIPRALIPVVARFSGELTCAEIAAEASEELGEKVSVTFVERIAAELDEGLFLQGATFDDALERVRIEFHDAAIRPASHAGGAYASDPKELAKYLDGSCLSHASAGRTDRADKTITALISPHIDPWRGAIGYGHAYAALRDALAPEADTFVLFGTSHAPMREPFALCRKGYDTPLGEMQADLEAIDRLAARCPYDPFADELNHKREHSIEFQAVFLRHVLGGRPARIVPILAGLGDHQRRGMDPSDDPRSMALLDAVQELVAERGKRAVIVAGADMAHVGPRFGDPAPLDGGARDALAGVNRTSIEHAQSGDVGAFWEHVAQDLDTRRVCGLAPIYATLRTMTPASASDLLHYEQNVNPDDGSIVSHAAVAFYGSPSR